MFFRTLFRTAVCGAVIALGIAAEARSAPQDRAVPDEQTPAAQEQTESTAAQVAVETSEGVEVLTRGPLHEAFATTIVFDPEPGEVIPSLPPDPIEEIAPDQKPEGENVTWMPGYYAWDDEREDFLWVSGIWRDLPPGRQWIPGYWLEVSGGAQWIPGYWGPAGVTEVYYLPEPPATVEEGPTTDPPSADYVWLPGTWVWHTNRYAWRPGYWVQMQPDWDWVPAYYVWTPRGYVFVDGYYDYTVSRRGVVFAPAWFDTVVYNRPDFYYRPSVVINTGLLTSHLFSRPMYHHYYFGDYYDTAYSNAGYYPWFQYGRSGFAYDPFFARYSWDHRSDTNWQTVVQTDFQNLQANADIRPPRTFADLTAVTASRTADASTMIAMSLDDFVTRADASQQFVALDEQAREDFSGLSSRIQTFRDARQQLESEVGDTASRDPGAQAEPIAANLSASPVVNEAKTAQGTDGATPATQDVPEVDLNVEPRARDSRDTTERERPDVDPRTKAREDRRGEKSKRNDETPRAKGKSKSDAPTDEPGTSAPKGKDKAKAGTQKDLPPKGKGKGKSNLSDDEPKTEPKSKAKSDLPPDAPKSDSPETDRPKTNPPESDRPKVNPPKADQPESDRPKVNPPKSERPKSDRPKGNPPKSDRPKANPPKSDSPKVNPPKADPPKVNPPKSDPPKADPPKVNPPKADPPKVNPPKSDPPKADPPKANPPKTDPPKVNPPKVNPPKSDPPKADPPKVNPPKDKPGI